MVGSGEREKREIDSAQLGVSNGWVWVGIKWAGPLKPNREIDSAQLLVHNANYNACATLSLQQALKHSIEAWADPPGCAHPQIYIYFFKLVGIKYKKLIRFYKVSNLNFLDNSTILTLFLVCVVLLIDKMSY
jgi:hypothetical protein